MSNESSEGDPLSAERIEDLRDDASYTVACEIHFPGRQRRAETTLALIAAHAESARRIAEIEDQRDTILAQLLAIEAVLAPYKEREGSYYQAACRLDREHTEFRDKLNDIDVVGAHYECETQLVAAKHDLTVARARIGELEGFATELETCTGYGDPETIRIMRGVASRIRATLTRTTEPEEK